MSETIFIAYAADCLLRARLDLPDTRLTDFLNERQELNLRDVTVQGLEDGRVVELTELALDLADVYAVEAYGPRGARERRIRTRSVRMEIGLDPYKVLGHLHAPPGAEPVAATLRRKPLVPVTSATIAFTLGGETHIRDIETLIINRLLVQSITAVDEDRLTMPVSLRIDPRAKDFTGVAFP
jgi:hypothetical protein